MKYKTIKVNKDLPGFKKGTSVSVEADSKGTPLLKFWRDRLHDAKTDKCVEIVSPKKEAPKEAAK